MPRPKNVLSPTQPVERLPLVVPELADAAQLLGVDLAEVERAAREVEPYIHADGSPRWSIRLLGVALGLEMGSPNPGQRSAKERKRRQAMRQNVA